MRIFSHRRSGVIIRGFYVLEAGQMERTRVKGNAGGATTEHSKTGRSHVHVGDV
jgi:hypothetical protein